MQNVELGPFTVLGLAGQGGMGTVWRARHAGTGETVAVKTVRGHAPHRARRFETEIRSLARLRHPHIVAILDYGTVRADAARALGTSDGTPWLAMEWLPDTPEAQAPRAVLEGVLRGLAHAHAHGVIHRDIKPSNLRCATGGTLRLTDFGVATSGDDPADRAGTLAYMAPEQLRGEPLGPFTDLYAVGCLAWTLLTGAPPIAVADPSQALWARVHWEMPDVPWDETLRTWLAMLLDPDPTRRFRSASEALHTLPPTGWTPVQTWAEVETDTVDLGTRLDVRPRRALAPPRRARLPLGAPPRPHLGAPARTGVRLFALREPEPVGRRTVIEALWADLMRVETDERPVVSVLSGAAGVGKSRMLSWLGRRLAASGALVLEVRHQAGEPPAQALRRALRDGPFDRTPLALPDALRDLVAGETDDARSAWDALAILLGRQARSRRVVLLVDDLQWGEPSLSSRLEGPVWVLATHRSPHMLEDVCVHVLQPLDKVDHRALVTELLDLEPSLAVEVAERAEGHPLYAVHLLADWIRTDALEPGADGLVLRRTADTGLPEALQDLLLRRVARWSGPARQALELAATLGRHVDVGEWSEVCREAGLDGLDGWLDRYARDGVLEPRGDTWSFQHGLLREALVEATSDPEALHRTCALALERLPPKPEILERAGYHRRHAGELAEAEADLVRAIEGYRMRDVDGPPVLRTASAALDVHRARGLSDRDPRGLQLRLVCVELEAARSRRYDDLDALERDARDAGEHRVVLRCQLVRVWRSTWVGRYAEGAALAGELAERSAGRGASETAALANLRKAGLLDHLGDRAGCEAALEDARAHAVASGAPRVEAQVLSRLGEHLLAQGKPELAQPLVERADVLYQRGATSSMARTNRLLLAEIHRKQGHFPQADAIASAVLASFREVGLGEHLMARLARLSGALCAFGAGDLARARDELDALYTRWRAAKHPYAVIASVHLAHLDAVVGVWESARALVASGVPFLPDADLVVAFAAIERAAEAAGQAALAADVHDLAAPWRAWQT